MRSPLCPPRRQSPGRTRRRRRRRTRTPAVQTPGAPAASGAGSTGSAPGVSQRDADGGPVALLLELEELAGTEPERRREKAGRKRLLRRVEPLHHVVVVPPRCRDLVLGVRELRLELLEVLAR